MSTTPPSNSSRDRSGAGRHLPSIALFVVTAALLVAGDLASKSAAFASVAGAPLTLRSGAANDGSVIPAHAPRVIVPRVLALHLTVNRGAVFGLGQGGRWIFIVFSVVATIVIVTIFARSDPRRHVLHLTLAAVLAGALGNLYDRLRFGMVRDLLHLFPDVRLPFGWTWPDGRSCLYPWIFNVADVCLVVGLFVLLALMLRQDRAAALERRAAGAS